jgi:hypothetical protein
LPVGRVDDRRRRKGAVTCMVSGSTPQEANGSTVVAKTPNIRRSRPVVVVFIADLPLCFEYPFLRCRLG